MSGGNRPKYRLVVKAKDGSTQAEEVGVFWQSKLDGCLNFQAKADSDIGQKLAKLLNTEKNWVNAWENKPKTDDDF
jgi:hypothetical protein